MPDPVPRLHFPFTFTDPVRVRPRNIRKVCDSVYSLSVPEGPPDIEVVFVHGLYLSDHRDAYWKSWISDNEDENGNEICWPVTWLGQQFPKAQIWSVSYDSWGSLLGENLVREMVELAHIGQKNCPVVFVCHSFGGLLVKDIVIKAHVEFGMNPQYMRFLQNIRGFHFYSTPHASSKLVDLALQIPNMRHKIHLLKTWIRGLGRLNDEFERLGRNNYAQKWRFAGVGESHKTQYRGFKGMVVDEASARWIYGIFMVVGSDHFGVCKPDQQTSPSYLSLTFFMKKVIESTDTKEETHCDGVDKSEMSLIAEHNLLSRRELYDNREISIFRVGDMEYLEGTLLDKDVLVESLKKTKWSILDILLRMDRLLKMVRIWHNQCQYLLKQYHQEVDKIVQALDVIIDSEKGLIIGLNLSLLQFICSKLVCAMWDGEVLLLFCSEKRNYNRAAFALSSPRLSGLQSFSRFALVLRELNWTVDLICYAKQLYVSRDVLLGDWRWCKSRRKLVYQGILGECSSMQDKILEGDYLRQTQDREAFLASLISKPTNLLSKTSSIFAKQAYSFSFTMYLALWTLVWNIFPPTTYFALVIMLWTPLCPMICFLILTFYNQVRLEASWKKRLQATSHVYEVNDNCRDRSGKKCNNEVSKSVVPTCYWIDNPKFSNPTSLGYGSNKVFMICKWLGEVVAVSMGRNIAPRQIFEEEVGLLALVQHPNVVELIGCTHDDLKGTLVTELMEKDLEALILNQGSQPPFDLPVAVDMALQIVEAMIHSHKCGVIHRDLKPKNFVASPKYRKDPILTTLGIPMYYTVKLIDFGEAKKAGASCLFHTHMRGTTVYRAPEVYKTEDLTDELGYSLPADVYSFAMTFYEILTGRAPFSDRDWRRSEVKRFVLEQQRPLFYFQIPSLLEDLIKRCWAQNPEDRPTFEDIRKDLWQCKTYYAYSEDHQQI